MLGLGMGIKAGVARVNITPPVGVELCGYGFYLNRKSTGIRDELYSKALVLSDDTSRVAIVANDLIGLNKEITETVRRLVTMETGIPGDHILLACTHTHHGPATVPLYGCGDIDYDYLNLLPKHIAGTVRMANANLQDAKIGAGKGNLDNISRNRVEKGGPIDPEVGIIRVDDIQDDPIALLINFSCHPVVMPVNTFISSDFPGRAISVVETVKKGVTGMFLQGACGDINPALTNTGNLEQPGVSLAAEALRVRERIQTMGRAQISAKTANIKLPLIVPTAEEVRRMLNEYKSKLDSKEDREQKYGKLYCTWAENTLKRLETGQEPWMETEIQAIQMDDIVLAAEPSEMFVKFCLDIKGRSPHKNTFILGYANDFVGYIPDKEDYERKGYAAALVPIITGNLPFTPDIGKILVDAMVDLIEQLPSNP
jgi:hypothetical protein